jgi:hypothetical protein
MAKPVVVRLGPDRLVSMKVIDWQADQIEKENAKLKAMEMAEDFAMEVK